jgi:hypothetical protein
LTDKAAARNTHINVKGEIVHTIGLQYSAVGLKNIFLTRINES